MNYKKRLINKCNNILIHNEKNCQCFDENNYPTNNIKECFKRKNTLKCKKYNVCKNLYSSFMNKEEPIYNPYPWLVNYIKSSHNCYTYFLNDHVPKTKSNCLELCKQNNTCDRKDIKVCNKLKPQPGYHAELSGTKLNKKFTCKNMIKRVKDDNNSIYETKFSKKCKKGYYKGALVVDPDRTYHFYRQDKNSRWSHKPGTLKVTNLDASNNPIYAPHLSDRNYNKNNDGGINYTDFCSYMCVPKNNNIKTHAI
jgi:hypothetical protein